MREEKSFSQRAFFDIRKLQDKAKTSYTLSTRRPRFDYESTVPSLNFREVDGALEVTAKNGLKMRAHTLVWHSQSFARTWTNIYKNSGDSPSYVKKAFELAYGMLKAYNVQDKVTLFYNDYNTYFGIQKTLNLVEFINAAKSMG